MKKTFTAIFAVVTATALANAQLKNVDFEAFGADGNLRYSITVTKFPNEAGWSGRWDVGDGFTTILTGCWGRPGNCRRLERRRLGRHARRHPG